MPGRPFRSCGALGGDSERFLDGMVRRLDLILVQQVVSRTNLQTRRLARQAEIADSLGFDHDQLEMQ